MEIIEAIRSRRSIRRFKPEPVPREVLEELLETCRWAPSGGNTQCWELFILGGKVMEEVKARLTEKVEMDVPFNLDIPMPEWTGPYLQRELQSREANDTAQFPPGTERLDEKRREYFVRGGRFHDAPNGIILCTEKAHSPKAIIDVGILAQTICLAAFAYGLGTCLMGRVVRWSDMLRELLGIPESKLIALGIAIGYPDHDAAINNWTRSREPLDGFVHWHGL